jgi:hypothetical protein
MVAQERHPSLMGIWISWASWQVSSNGTLGDVETKHLHLAVDAGCPPGWILRIHLPNQVANLSVGTWSTATIGACFPPPVSSKALPMPSDHSFRLDDDEGVAPPGPQAVKQHPENAVRYSQPGGGLLGLQNGKLLTECHVLEGNVDPRPQLGADELS